MKMEWLEPQKKKKKIKFNIINYKNKYKAEKKMLILLKKNKISLICLAGFMKILSKNFLKCFGFPVLNIHPSLLPKYKGLNTHKRVIFYKEKISGCTVHLVSNKLDSGRIILQKKVRVSKNDTEKSLGKKVLFLEHRLYPKAITKFIKEEFNL